MVLIHISDSQFAQLLGKTFKYANMIDHKTISVLTHFIKFWRRKIIVGKVTCQNYLLLSSTNDVYSFTYTVMSWNVQGFSSPSTSKQYKCPLTEGTLLYDAEKRHVLRYISDSLCPESQFRPFDHFMNPPVITNHLFSF